MRDADRRTDPRLQLCYPIEVRTLESECITRSDRTVTQELSARGAYFCVSGDAPCSVGSHVSIVVSVPHRLADDGREVTVDLRGDARVVRVDRPARGGAGEDGVQLTGVALQFDEPLAFSFAWM